MFFNFETSCLIIVIIVKNNEIGSAFAFLMVLSSKGKERVRLFLHFILIVFFQALLFLPNLVSTSASASELYLQNPSYLIAQSDPDEAFDPFTDYSEFDESSDEEADINFFQNGRFFTFGLITGTRGFTGNFKKYTHQVLLLDLFLVTFLIYDLDLLLEYSPATMMSLL